MNRTRLIIAGAIVLCLAVIGLVIVSATQSIGSLSNGTVKLNLVPADASVSADGGKTVKTDALSLSPGPHKLTFTRGGFASKTVDVKVEAHKTQELKVALGATSAAGKDYINNHPEEGAIRDSLGEQEAKQHADAITQDAPLIQLLPYHGNGFDIDVGASQKYKDDAHAAAVYITADTPQARTAAINWIKAQGYDPAGYEIIYQTYAGAQ